MLPYRGKELMMGSLQLRSNQYYSVFRTKNGKQKWLATGVEGPGHIREAKKTRGGIGA